ncbi:SurA N-terminal domain-containing protein [Ornithinibacillus caprae]|nr:SurA N-terminal domain-containing protein [Ornithinibacillus caprae]
MKKLLLLIVAVGLAAVLVACGDDEGNEENAEAPEAPESSDGEQAAQEFEVTEDEKVAEDEVVVTVNGKEVTGVKYNPVYAQTKMTMANYGMDMNDRELVKEQTINELVAQELLKQEAEQKGIDVTEDEVQGEIDAIEEEELEAYLEQMQLTEDQLKEQLTLNLTVNKYMEQELTVEEVSDEELKETYDQLKEQNGEGIGEFEELKDTLRQQLMQQKQTELLQAKLEELQEQAEVETLI